VSINAIVVALALASGPSLAALLLSVASWRALFMINIPIGLLVLVIGARWLAREDAQHHDIDWSGMLLSMAAFGSGIFALNAFAHDWDARLTIVAAIITVVAGVVFVRHQKGQAAPLLPLDILRLPLLRFSVLTHFVAAAAQVMAYISIPFALHEVGWDQAHIGLIFTAWPLAIMLVSPAAGYLSNRFPLGLLGSLGLIVFAAGLVSVTFLPAEASVFAAMWRVALCGLGYGFFQTPNTRALITSVPLVRTSAASVLGAQGRVLGQAMGAALVAFAFAAPESQATNLSLRLAAGVAMLGVLTSGVRLRFAPA
jgi:DHA2 family multidrug resistance protein-like MFS transporter